MSASSRRSSSRRNDEAVVAAEGDSLAVSQPGKVLFPRDGITKLDVVHYYVDIAPVLLPHIRGRPLTFKPFPRGIDEKSYYLRSLPSDQPAWLRSVAYQPRTERTRISPVVATDVRTLVWAANRDALEVHPWLCRADDLE
ncbi:MAG: ATP-dependent DNA ligase, partial [Chloroflexi bacterium]|nr:ATP-dependent DNA ligase [Chloroflexota bacterium]